MNPYRNETQLVEDIPERGSFWYWFFIGFMTFFVWVASAAIVFLVLISFFRYAAWAGLLTASVIAPIFAIRKHRKLGKMSTKEYPQYFIQPQTNTTMRFRHTDHSYQDSRSPLDPASTLYWTLGPGNPFYDERN